MELTKENIEQFAESYKEILEHIETAANLVYNVRNNTTGKYHIDIDKCRIDLDYGIVDLRWEEYYCGSTDHEYFTFPMDYLWDEDWIVEEKKKQEEEEKAKKLAAEKAKKRRDAEQEKLEYKKYIELKNKYEK